LPAAEAKRIERVKGDITNPKSLRWLMRGCDAVIHLVGIIEEMPDRGVTFEAMHHQGTVHVVDEARDSEIDIFIQMSANGARRNGVSAYQTTKWKAEEYVRNAGFAHWTIFRPSFVFGKPGPDQPEFASRLLRTLIRPFPILPVFGDGEYLMQPVAAEDVAAAFVQALGKAAASGKSYCTAGPVAYPYTEILDIIAEGAGLESKPQIKQPIWLVRPIVNTVGRLGLLPISPDQFEMLLEGNSCDPSLLFKDFELKRIPFTAENLRYLLEA
jgi:NADH dehydrogenase